MVDLTENIFDQIDELKAVLQSRHEHLKQQDREIIMNFYFQEKTKNQICNELNISAVYFDKVLFRAKQRLKTLIEINE